MKVSVLMSVHNAMPYIQAAVNSILQQLEEDFEFLIYDDHSSDGSSEVLASIAHPRVRVYGGNRLGLAGAMNYLLERSTGCLIARMDADDVAMPRRLHKQVLALESNSELAVVGSSAMQINELGVQVAKVIKPCSHAEIVRDLCCKTPLIHPSVMIRRSALIAVGGYDASLKRAQDKDLWLRFNERNFRFSNLSDCLIEYRIVENKQSKDLIFERMEAQLKIAYKHRSLKIAIHSLIQNLSLFLQRLAKCGP